MVFANAAKIHKYVTLAIPWNVLFSIFIFNLYLKNSTTFATYST